MAKGTPIGEEERVEIVEAIRSGKARNDIARDFERSPGVVSKIALAEGLSFERAAETATAAEARKADLAQRRSDLRNRFMDEANGFLDQLHEPHVVIGWHKGEAFEHQLPEPDARSKRDLMIAAGICVDKALRLDDADAQGLAAVDAWLRSIVGGAA